MSREDSVGEHGGGIERSTWRAGCCSSARWSPSTSLSCCCRQLVNDAKTAAADIDAGPGGHGGAALQSSPGRLTPAHRHFGSATTRTREEDATQGRPGTEDHQIQNAPTGPLTTEGSRKGLGVGRASAGYRALV
jgi:hypothetical protein